MAQRTFRSNMIVSGMPVRICCLLRSPGYSHSHPAILPGPTGSQQLSPHSRQACELWGSWQLCPRLLESEYSRSPLFIGDITEHEAPHMVGQPADHKGDDHSTCKTVIGLRNTERATRGRRHPEVMDLFLSFSFLVN